jgi:hypothetical protein
MGFLHKRLSELEFADVSDPRGKKGRRWPLPAFFHAVIAGIISGQKSLRDVELMTVEISALARRLLGIKRRVPDTTMRDALVRTQPADLRAVLHKTIQLSVRRKSLAPVGLPCGVVAMDGKWTGTTIVDEAYTQHHSKDAHSNSIEQLRTVTSCLISSNVKVCLDAFPIPPSTNEKGIFTCALDALLTAYPGLFEIITYDPGANSKSNASYVDKKGLGYVFGLKADQGTLLLEAQRLLGHLSGKEALEETQDYIGGKTVIRRLWKTTEMAGYYGWNHLRMAIRVQSMILSEDTGGIESIEDRYFITNVHIGRLNDAQWLSVIRRHWAVENNCHNIWDRILREDDRVWIREPQGMLAVQILRRIAYNLMALFRGVTQRSEERREIPWKDLMREFYLAFMRLTRMHFPEGSKLRRVYAVSY